MLPGPARPRESARAHEGRTPPPAQAAVFATASSKAGSRGEFDTLRSLPGKGRENGPRTKRAAVALEAPARGALHSHGAQQRVHMPARRGGAAVCADAAAQMQRPLQKAMTLNQSEPGLTWSDSVWSQWSVTRSGWSRPSPPATQARYRLLAQATKRLVPVVRRRLVLSDSDSVWVAPATTSSHAGKICSRRPGARPAPSHLSCSLLAGEVKLLLACFDCSEKVYERRRMPLCMSWLEAGSGRCCLFQKRQHSTCMAPGQAGLGLLRPDRFVHVAGWL